MHWHYKCPICNQPNYINWEDRAITIKCNVNQDDHIPPSPSEQHDAYVNQHDWPVVIEEVVLSVKGKNCSVPGCSKFYETLDHRMPWCKGGHTSVSNLFPICNEHNLSKGDENYFEWLKSLKIKLCK